MKPRVLRRAGEVVPFARAADRSTAAEPAGPPPLEVQRPRAPLAQPAPAELWVGVHLPELALDALPVGAKAAPRAVLELQDRVQRIVVPDASAARAGVRAGMSLAAALALVSELQTAPREPWRERQLLERLAVRAQRRFTPRVSLEPPDGLLLEVKGSLHLFGGARELLRALAAECSDAGVRAAPALAPTPLAALAAARAGRALLVTERTRLIGQLAALPLAALRWPPEVLERLERMGVRTVGQVLRLPRAGFARRFGAKRLEMLDRLVGRRPDLRERFEVREPFRGRCELTYEIEHQAAVLAALGPLLEELGQFLRERQCGITRLDCRLRHRHAPATRCVLALAAPEADARRLAELLGERLAQLALPEPVRACELRSGPLVPRALPSASLWQPGEHGGAPGAEPPALIERLRARLGADAVYGLELFPEHRPERAFRTAEPRAGLQHSAAGRAAARAQAEGSAPLQRPAGAPPREVPWAAFGRPLWLLARPEPLAESQGLPRYRGPLRLGGEPERIETGWWDGADAARDYYVATDLRGVRLWIFRERAAPHRWFLHGVFG